MFWGSCWWREVNESTPLCLETGEKLCTEIRENEKCIETGEKCCLEIGENEKCIETGEEEKRV